MILDKSQIARTVSNILYPGITGAVFTFVLYFSLIGFNLKSFFLATGYSSLITLAPFLVIRRLVKQGRIDDRDVSIRQQRSVFFKTSMPFYLLALGLLFLAQVPKTILLMGIGVMGFVVIYFLISFLYKISVHVGGLTFDIIAMGLILSKNFYFLLPLIPVLAWSRYHLKKHTLGESFSGALVGGGIPLILCRLFMV